jgi:cobalt-zinc-cadmium efflux system protein
MEGAPFDIAPEQVGRALAAVPGVASVHDLHIWQVKAGEPLLSAHLVLHDIANWEGVLEASYALLADRFDIQHATLQPEPPVRTVRWGKPPSHDHDDHA